MKIQHISKRINYEMLLTHAKKIDLIEIIIIFIESKLSFFTILYHITNIKIIGDALTLLLF